MATSVNDRFFDHQVAQSIRWIRYGNHAAVEALKILNRIDVRLTEYLNGVLADDWTYSQARAAAMKQQVASIMNAIHNEVAAEVTAGLLGASVLSAEIEAEMFRLVLPAGLDITTPNPGLVRTIMTTRPFNGSPLTDWVDQLRRNDVDRTWRTIQDGMVAGDTTPDIVKAVRGTASLRYRDGVREVSRRGLDTLVRTATNHAASVGRQSVWDQNHHIVDKVRWVSTLDSRTSPICRDRDGQTFPVNSGPRPPAHMNCRSTTVAVTKTWREMGFDVDELDAGTRASMDGQVPGDMTYYQWLNQTSRANALEALGPTRYGLWKNQGIAPSEFVNDRGRLYTLDELRALRPGAFTRP